MGFCEISTLLFIILKTTHVVNWSWWVVFIPMYPAILFYLILLILFTFGLFAAIFQK